MLALPEAVDFSPLVPSVTATLNEYTPEAVVGETRDNVSEPLAPGASRTLAAGLNEDVHPLGAAADAVNSDAAQPEPLLFVTVIVYLSGVAAAPLCDDGESDTPGAAAEHNAEPNSTRTSAPAMLDESAVRVTPVAVCVTLWPTSKVESHVVVAGARSI